MTFLPLDRVIYECSANSASIEQLGREYKPAAARTADPGIKQRDIHNPKWIPFAHDGGETFLGIDMDPSEGGRQGQVIFIDHADNTVILVAPTLSQFLWNYVADLENGRYFLNPDALRDGDEFLNCQKDIDIVNWAFSPRWEHLRQDR